MAVPALPVTGPSVGTKKYSTGTRDRYSFVFRNFDLFILVDCCFQGVEIEFLAPSVPTPVHSGSVEWGVTFS